MLRGFTRAIVATTTECVPTSAKASLFARKSHTTAANNVSHTSASNNSKIFK